MASNTAAWITAPKARPLEVKPSTIGVPGDDHILIKNRAVAINPIDGKLQALALYPLNYPEILGQDVAGEVIEVGPNVTRFKKGDRVLGNAIGFHTKRNEEKGFQAYTILETHMASKIPASMSFETAVVLPLGTSTAACGLFHADFLNLQLPTEPAQKLTGKVLLVWGGASSVGCNAIQLAVAAGYEVIATASPKNFELVKKLGASQVFDYHETTVLSKLLEATKNKSIIGAYDTVGGAVCGASIEFVQKSEGTKHVVTVIPGFPEPPEGIKVSRVYAPSVRDNHVAEAIYEDFLPKALEAGSYVPAPEPLVAGKGLENVQDAIDIQSKGLSAQKAVVLL